MWICVCVCGSGFYRIFPSVFNLFHFETLFQFWFSLSFCFNISQFGYNLSPNLCGKCVCVLCLWMYHSISTLLLFEQALLRSKIAADKRLNLEVYIYFSLVLVFIHLYLIYINLCMHVCWKYFFVCFIDKEISDMTHQGIFDKHNCTKLYFQHTFGTTTLLIYLYIRHNMSDRDYPIFS